MQVRLGAIADDTDDVGFRCRGRERLQVRLGAIAEDRGEVEERFRGCR